MLERDKVIQETIEKYSEWLEQAGADRDKVLIQILASLLVRERQIYEQKLQAYKREKLIR